MISPERSSVQGCLVDRPCLNVRGMASRSAAMQHRQSELHRRRILSRRSFGCAESGGPIPPRTDAGGGISRREAAVPRTSFVFEEDDGHVEGYARAEPA